jgi:hypothetical protein
MCHNKIIFFSLIGDWQLLRTINQADQLFTAKGTTSFTKVDDSKLLYQEECTLCMPDSKLIMTREYFYLYNKDKDQIEKYFSQDQKQTYLFYVIDKNHEGSHLCVKDTYKAKYSFEKLDKSNEFTLTYHVKGPTKNYTSITTYTR